ncbi:Increased recombination centers protein 22 [Nakaseomyces glabratus]|uniref:Increased recombination centers protein 22 n=1 Tax=Candida glabrata TaxID=5478 RepID=A0A0W0D9H1_CANGB|nr:hypothetical protein J6894_04159 [Nakaseomyces glabratus]KAI8392740.1 hypothetical protein J6895_04202 [Nakaseomyces glabratus]KAJ9568942.1 Increased recombination centers protein 22 [Nakaseomyces glabratus]KTB01193.1 Increased recombination centers protein 22 [Nakaseomyces glabratus]KTB08499.1 Increased recombination centers protein 22 [Nakaseomyces glabratus]
MKFLHIGLMTLMAGFSNVLAQEEANAEDVMVNIEGQDMTMEEAEAYMAAKEKMGGAQQQREMINLQVNYDLLEEPFADLQDFIVFEVGETATLNYTIHNLDQEETYSIVGVSGAVLSEVDQRNVANLTETNITEIVLAPNATGTLRHKIDMNLTEGRYYILPLLHVKDKNEVKRVMSNPFKLDLINQSISIFDPSFLSIIAVLIALVGGTVYLYSNVVAPPKKIKKKEAIPAKIDESWLPDVHKK